MEFGKLTNIDHIQWAIPQCDVDSLKNLAISTKHKLFTIHFGAPAWVNKKWIGRIYPPKIKSSEYLFYYSRSFNTIELNSSHYHIPTTDQCTRWISQTPHSFRFCPKVFQGISHTPQGLRDVKLIQDWLLFLEKMRSRLGICFLQLPPHFCYTNKSDLFQFFKQWPNDLQLAVEFRHPSWFQGNSNNRTLLPSVREYFQKQNISALVTDVAGRREVLHGTVTTNTFLLRFNGYNLHSSDGVRTAMWASRLKELKDHGLNEVYLFIHQPGDDLIPELTDLFLSQINELCGTTTQLQSNLSEKEKAPLQGAFL